MTNAFTAVRVASGSFKPSNAAVRIRCPVELIGKYSVIPSTMPRSSASHELTLECLRPLYSVTGSSRPAGIGDDAGARARSEPAPVNARTSSSSNAASADGSRALIVPSQPRRKPHGIETMPGLLNGNQAQSPFGKSAFGAPDTTGEKNTSVTHVIRPP